MFLWKYMEFNYNRVIDNWFQTNNMFCTIDKGFGGGHGIYYTIVEKERSTKEGKLSPEIILHDFFYEFIVEQKSCFLHVL